ncbi:MAG TPA: redoxin domain-containing protein [Terriglobales bacterium]|nr:redoxin domain-containing protein [Terriglobales bacterium]
MKRDPVIILVVAMVITLALAFGYQMSRHAPSAKASIALQGKAAPDFALQSTDGKTVHLSDFRGKAVLLNFWATWCEPCKIEMPWFAELQKQYGPEGLQVVGVSVDDDATADDLAKFAKDLGVNYPILLGKENVENAYGGVQFLPATLYIDREGKIVDKVFGLKGRGEIEDGIKKILGPGQSAEHVARLQP